MSLSIPEAAKFLLNFVHPTIMWGLLAIALYALYLGIQARRTRTADKDTRKELVKGKFALKHYQIGSLLLALMATGTIGGMAVTYINNEKLFLAPHLLVGLGMTGLIATSAALAPLMQQGKNWARYTHIALNVTLVGLFSWQAVTGMEIVQKILNNES